MESREAVRERIEDAALFAILRRVPEDRLGPTVEALIRGGIRVAEITWDDESSPGLLARVVNRYGASVLWGMGTVLSAEQVARAEASGAAFIVTPAFVPEVARECGRRGLLLVSGALTPTEVHAAWESGAGLVKVFPAGCMGPDYFRELLGPFPHLRLVAVGGVTAESAPSFLRAGARAVGVGGNLVRRDLIERVDWDGLAEVAARFVGAVKEVRSPCCP